MADFVAVIRRAVDGLANNTPEMRVKVYDKARSAVVRQLESMKPRPPEALFQRQLEKLEQAITEVEAEHAEALPEEGGAEPAVAAAAPFAAEPEPAEAEPEPVADEPEPVPAEEEPAPADEEPAPAYEEPAPVYEEPEEPATEEIRDEAQPWTEPASEPAGQPHEEEPVYEAAAPWQAEEVPVEEPAVIEGAGPYEEPPAYSDLSETREQVETGYADDLPEHAAAEPPPEDYVEPAFAPEPEPAFEAPQPEPEPVEPHAPVEPSWEAEATEEPVFPAEADAVEPEAPLWPAEEAAVSPPPVEDAGWDWPSHGEIALPDAAAPDTGRSPDSIIDDFDAYLEGRVPTQPEPAVSDGAAGKARSESDDAWSDFEALIGYEGGAPAAGAVGGAAVSAIAASEKLAADKPAGEERLAPETAYPYRAVPKPKPSLAKIGLAALAVLLLAGGGYALWLNRDALTDLFNGPATPSGTPVVANGNGAATPASGAATPATPAQKAEEGVISTKFTQRLTVDGKEIDEGPAGQNGAPAGEGQSVAQQNVAPQPQTQQPAGGQGATATAPAARGEKMYLYEEMLGQTTPTAIEGGVAWEAREEKDDAGRPQTVVQGTITVPGRNLTALVTFKRNTDPSLPASHLVEVVFSLPADFEGGAIESVQRISMKRTEQDRGNALIAVPARITDDFHMIALNDFPDARATNLELMKSRDWIDIPVTYRNGRRALLTMEKGKTGMEAFDKAVTQWQQAEPPR